MKAANKRCSHNLVAGLTVFIMRSFSEHQSYDDNILFQRLGLVVTPAEDWERCNMPLMSSEIIAKVLEEQGTFFDNAEIIIKVLEYLDYPYELNEHNQKHYWLVNPA